MNSDIDHVLSAALALPNGDRVELVEAILASLQPNDRPPFDESWRPVIERRSQELRSGIVSGIPWSEVKARARGFPCYDAIHRFAIVRRFPYSIVYQTIAGDLYVVAIAHSSRSPGYWQDRV